MSVLKYTLRRSSVYLISDTDLSSRITRGSVKGLLYISTVYPSLYTLAIITVTPTPTVAWSSTTPDLFIALGRGVRTI